MAAAVDAISATDDGSYQQRMASNLARHLALVEQYGDAVESLNLDDAAILLGHRPDSTVQADELLERFVREAGPEYDVDLLALFHRRTERKRQLLPEFDPATAPAGDVGPYLDHCHLAPLAAVLADGTQ